MVFMMGNRKRRSKRQIDIQPVDFNVGASVVVKSDVNDTEYSGDISGWQGRITELITDEKGVPTGIIEWDSLTLRKRIIFPTLRFERHKSELPQLPAVG